MAVNVLENLRELEVVAGYWFVNEGGKVVHPQFYSNSIDTKLSELITERVLQVFCVYHLTLGKAPSCLEVVCGERSALARNFPAGALVVVYDQGVLDKDLRGKTETIIEEAIHRGDLKDQFFPENSQNLKNPYVQCHHLLSRDRLTARSWALLEALRVGSGK